MLQLTQLLGFAARSQAADLTPNLVSIADVTNAGFVASALTTPVTITGIDAPVTLRLTVSSPLAVTRTASIFRDALLVAQADNGSFVDFQMNNAQSLQIELANATDLTTWSGTATLSNLSDGGVILATFAFTLQDTGSGGGGGGGG
ncbi:MAG: hypothetical protein ABL973_20865, partial [Micropepsaceae bacterium]